jgi:hypothetical protein
MIAEAVNIDGPMVVSSATLVAIVLAAIKLSITGTRFAERMNSLAKSVKLALAKTDVLEDAAQYHRHEDNTRHHTFELRLAAIERELGIPTAVLHDVTPRVQTIHPISGRPKRVTWPPRGAHSENAADDVDDDG